MGLAAVALARAGDRETGDWQRDREKEREGAHDASRFTGCFHWLMWYLKGISRYIGQFALYVGALIDTVFIMFCLRPLSCDMYRDAMQHVCVRRFPELTQGVCVVTSVAVPCDLTCDSGGGHLRHGCTGCCPSMLCCVDSLHYKHKNLVFLMK